MPDLPKRIDRTHAYEAMASVIVSLFFNRVARKAIRPNAQVVDLAAAYMNAANAECDAILSSVDEVIAFSNSIAISYGKMTSSVVSEESFRKRFASSFIPESRHGAVTHDDIAKIYTQVLAECLHRGRDIAIQYSHEIIDENVRNTPARALAIINAIKDVIVQSLKSLQTRYAQQILDGRAIEKKQQYHPADIETLLGHIKQLTLENILLKKRLKMQAAPISTMAQQPAAATPLTINPLAPRTGATIESPHRDVRASESGSQSEGYGSSYMTDDSQSSRLDAFSDRSSSKGSRVRASNVERISLFDEPAGPPHVQNSHQHVSNSQPQADYHYQKALQSVRSAPEPQARTVLDSDFTVDESDDWIGLATDLGS